MSSKCPGPGSNIGTVEAGENTRCWTAGWRRRHRSRGSGETPLRPNHPRHDLGRTEPSGVMSLEGLAVAEEVHAAVEAL